MWNTVKVAVLFCVIGFVACTLPDYISVCKHDDPDLASCINNSIVSLKPKLKEGIPELEVPPLKQFLLGDLNIGRFTEGSGLTTNLSDFTVFGADDFHILKLTPTKTKHGYNFFFEVNVPTVHAEGRYELDSRLLFLDLKGRGPFNINITDYHFNCVMKGKKVKQQENTHLRFDKMKCDATISGAKINLENLFNGQEVLARATNDAVNDNIDILFDEIKPNILSALEGRFTEIANKITSAFTYDELFP